MKVAEFLSDLTSLQVCDPGAALALVSARPPTSVGETDGIQRVSTKDKGDADLARARDLVELHANVKLAHLDGTDKELDASREAVAGVLRNL